MANNNQYGENNPNWKGGLITKTCLVCKNEFNDYPSYINKRKCCSRKCRGELISGDNHPSWIGGRVKRNNMWFIRISKGKYKREHIVIMEELIGRKLEKNECIHHIDKNTLNNNPDNLLLTDNNEHGKIHYKEFNIDKYGRLMPKGAIC